MNMNHTHTGQNPILQILGLAHALGLGDVLVLSWALWKEHEPAKIKRGITLGGLLGGSAGSFLSH